jgi:hypothetical protein
MASPARTKARTELNVALAYIDRATCRLDAEPGHARDVRTLERLAGELGEVLAKLIAAEQRRREES